MSSISNFCSRGASLCWCVFKCCWLYPFVARGVTIVSMCVHVCVYCCLRRRLLGFGHRFYTVVVVVVVKCRRMPPCCVYKCALVVSVLEGKSTSSNSRKKTKNEANEEKASLCQTFYKYYDEAPPMIVARGTLRITTKLD